MIAVCTVLPLFAVGCVRKPVDVRRAGTDSGPQVAYLALAGSYWQVFTMPIGFLDAQQVTYTPVDKVKVSWFPDGNRLLVNTIQGLPVLLDLHSLESHEMPLPWGRTFDAVVSPDGRRVAYSVSVSDFGDDNDIWLVSLDGDDPVKLTTMPGLQHEPAWSVDGKWVYFLSGEGGQTHDIWRIAPDTRAVEQITAGSLYQFDVAPSPTGDIAFSSNRSGSYDIWVRHEDGEFVPWTDDSMIDASPCWTTDGRLLFESTRNGRANIWVLDGPRGDPHQVTHNADGARNPACRPASMDRGAANGGPVGRLHAAGQLRMGGPGGLRQNPGG